MGLADMTVIRGMDPERVREALRSIRQTQQTKEKVAKKKERRVGAKTCSEPGCTNLDHAKGYCYNCYMRAYRKQKRRFLDG